MNFITEFFVEYLQFQQSTFSSLILPLIIFLARITDVSIGTIRVILISRGSRFISAGLGFFEVLIWLVVTGQVMQNLESPLSFIAYAAGFAAGNFVGVTIEGKMALGFVLVRIVARHDATELAEHLRGDNYGVTMQEALGAQGEVKLLFTVVARKDLNKIVSTVQKFNPKAFMTIEDVRGVSDGVFPSHQA